MQLRRKFQRWSKSTEKEARRAETLWSSAQREKAGVIPSMDEHLGVHPPTVAPEKRVKPQRWNFGRFFDVVVHSMLSSTCQLVKREVSA
jgi:hypothetical protein